MTRAAYVRVIQDRNANIWRALGVGELSWVTCLIFMELHPRSLTYPLKGYLPNRKVVFQPSIFQVLC